MKSIDVYGITINEYPLKELLKISSDNLNTPGVTTVSWLSRTILRSAKESPEQLDWINDIDVTIYSQADAKKGAGENNDGKSQDFLENYIKYLANTGVSVALVCDSEERLNKAKRWLMKYSNKLKITSEYIIEDLENRDDLYNVLNGQMNRLVITVVGWNFQGPLLANAHRISNAAVWLAVLPEMMNTEDDKKKVPLLKKISRTLGIK